MTELADGVIGASASGDQGIAAVRPRIVSVTDAAACLAATPAPATIHTPALGPGGQHAIADSNATAPPTATTGAMGCCPTCSCERAEARAAVPTAATSGATVRCSTRASNWATIPDAGYTVFATWFVAGQCVGPMARKHVVAYLIGVTRAVPRAVGDATSITACRSALLEAGIGPDELGEVAAWLCPIVDSRPATRDRATSLQEIMNNAMKVSLLARWAVGGAVGCTASTVITSPHPRRA